MSDEGVKRRKFILVFLAAAATVGVFLFTSRRELPPEMIASQQVAERYVQLIRDHKTAELAPLQAADYVAPSEDEVRQIREAGSFDMSHAVLGEKGVQACVGGGLRNGPVASDTVRVYLRHHDGEWKVSHIQAFDNFSPAKPPWPQNWGGARLQGTGACALGY